MSDTVKLIIEIPKETYMALHRSKFLNMPLTVEQNAIADGTPLSEVLDEIKKEILDYNVRQRVLGSESFLLGYCAGMDKSAEIINKHIGDKG